MKLFKKSGKKSSIVDEVQNNMDRATSSTFDCASWYQQAFEISSKEDLEWDAHQDTLKALDEIRTEDLPIRMHS